MVYYIQEGDIFKIPQIKNYAHGCNCSGAMGNGIALLFREKFPLMYKQYKELCKEGKFKTGGVFCYRYEHGVVFNLGTQESWKEKAQYEHIEASLLKMMEIARNNDIREIVMPAVGAGLGGTSWDLTKRIINKVANNNPSVDLYCIEHYKDIEIEITYVKKQWAEENVVYYIQFIGDDAIRQVEKYPDRTIYLSTANPVYEDSILYDQGLQLIKSSLSSKNYITKDDFKKVWKPANQGR